MRTLSGVRKVSQNCNIIVKNLANHILFERAPVTGRRRLKGVFFFAAAAAVIEALSLVSLAITSLVCQSIILN